MSIFGGNGGDDFWADGAFTLTATYTTPEEPIPGLDNLTSGPLFAVPGNHGYHLQSTGGRWDLAANGGSGDVGVKAGPSAVAGAGLRLVMMGLPPVAAPRGRYHV